MESSAHRDEPAASDYLELWKHHAAFGGEDKNRMVAVVSFILGFSAAVLGVVASLPVEEGSWIAFEKPGRAIVFSALGTVVSGIAAYTVLLYAGYSNQNWRKADSIAKNQPWECLTKNRKLSPRACNHSLAALSEKLAKPCEPDRELAPVFITFLVLSLVIMLVHVVIIITAVFII